VVYLGVNDGRLEQGSLRADANVSVRPVGQQEFGTKTEIKNMNSFRAIERAVEYEINRQIEEIEFGGRIVQETRLWNEEKQTTISMRSKEGSADYRYFPDPDLIPMTIGRDMVEEIRATMPELPAAKRARYQQELSLSAYDANVLVADKAMTEFFDAAVKAYGENPKGIANWLIGDISAQMNYEKVDSITALNITPAHVAELVKLIDAGTISGSIAKKVLQGMLKSGEMPKAIVEAQGLAQISDTGPIVAAIQEVLANSATQVAQYHGGQTKVVGFLVGQVMKATQGRAKPDLVNKLLVEALEKQQV
jgi:aspartyl-tRNA(Asn)/glutamyl-tRNA(Gln) amidotransferase subunit B